MRILHVLGPITIPIAEKKISNYLVSWLVGLSALAGLGVWRGPDA